jgi:tight adherence protein B
MLEQAKLGWTVGRFFFYSACLMLVGALIGNWWIPVGFVGWIPGLVLGLAPLCWIVYKRSQRFRRFNVLLPDAIDLIARALRAGHSLPSALVTVAEEVADPLGSEFQHCADEMNFGLPFREAMYGMLKRFPLQDLHFLVSAILVQRETGGNLAELLDKAASACAYSSRSNDRSYPGSSAFYCIRSVEPRQARLYGATLRDGNWSQAGLRYAN